MARGFESKDVEFQQAEAERRKTLGPDLTPEQRDREARRRTLELALAKARADRAGARTDAHRRMLDAAIGTLEQEMESLKLVT